MNSHATFTPSPTDRFQITEGVRRAKAALRAGHKTIRAEIVLPNGSSLGVHDLPLDSLLSPKRQIRRAMPADEVRWQRAVAGASLPVLPFPPILVYPGKQGTPLNDVQFDFGGNP